MVTVTRETHTCPPEIQDRLTRAGGLNRFGEPNFRIVWNWSRLAWAGGWWMDWDTDGNLVREVFEMREEPKWLPRWDRWILETWRPPEWFGSPWFWDLTTAVFSGNEASRMLPSIGPYPSRGDYMHVTTLDYICDKCKDDVAQAITQPEKLAIYSSCQDRQFLQVSPRVADTLARMVMRNREQTAQEIKAGIQSQLAAEAKMAEKMAEERIGQAMDRELPKETMDYIERVSGPAMNAHLAQLQKRMDSLPPESRSKIKNRGFQFNPKLLN